MIQPKTAQPSDTLTKTLNAIGALVLIAFGVGCLISPAVGIWSLIVCIGLISPPVMLFRIWFTARKLRNARR